MKKITIAIIVILIIAVTAFLIYSYSNSNNLSNEIDSIPNSEFASLDTNDQVFNEIDNSLNELN